MNIPGRNPAGCASPHFTLWLVDEVMCLVNIHFLIDGTAG